MRFRGTIYINNFDYTIQADTPACSCVDCVDACPVPPPVSPKQNFIIFGMDGYSVVMFFVFIVCSGLFLIGTCCNSQTKILSGMHENIELVMLIPFI